MKSFLLEVETLEDRCVPAAPNVFSQIPAGMTITLISPSGQTFTIDPYLIDPNGPNGQNKPIIPGPNPEAWGQGNQWPVPPAADPFWISTGVFSATGPGGWQLIITNPNPTPPDDGGGPGPHPT